MKFWKQIKDKSVGILAGILIATIVGFGSFAFRLYDTVEHVVPAMGQRLNGMEDTIKNINSRPAKIERKVGLMEKDVDNIKDDVKDNKNMLIQLQQDNKDILKLLIQIKNGN